MWVLCSMKLVKLGGWVLFKKKDARVAYLCKFTKTYEEHIARLSQGLGRVLHN